MKKEYTPVMVGSKKLDGRAFWRYHNLPDTCDKVKGIKLKNCPFCDSKAVAFRIRYKGSVSYSARCSAFRDVCSVQPTIRDINDERFKRARGVAAVWNKRHENKMNK